MSYNGLVKSMDVLISHCYDTVLFPPNKKSFKHRVSLYNCSTSPLSLSTNVSGKKAVNINPLKTVVSISQVTTGILT